MAAGEFDLIARYFAPLAAGSPGSFGLQNDAALLDLDPQRSLVLTLDTMVAGVHFLPDDPPGSVASKLLRVNLSDLAAMGARPLGYLLSSSLPENFGEDWLRSFAAGLAEDQKTFGLTLLGGDTTSTPGPLSLSLTALGSVPKGRCLARGTARAGDAVYVSGVLGNGLLGLWQLRDQPPRLTGALRQAAIGRYRRPDPRLALGEALLSDGLATAALDISDGLVGDLRHIAEASGLAACIEADLVPWSEAARAALTAEPKLRGDLLAGGDEYELLFTADPARAPDLARLSARLGLPLTAVGSMTAGEGVSVLDAEGRPLALTREGWTHF